MPAWQPIITERLSSNKIGPVREAIQVAEAISLGLQSLRCTRTPRPGVRSAPAIAGTNWFSFGACCTN